MERLIKGVHNWIEDRPTMKANNWGDSTVISLFCEEVGEMCEATAGKGLDELRTSIEVREELADLGLYLLSIFEMLRLDFEEVCFEKLAFNLLRYPSSTYQSGDFTEAHTWNREMAKKRHLKEQFYQEAA